MRQKNQQPSQAVEAYVVFHNVPSPVTGLSTQLFKRAGRMLPRCVSESVTVLSLTWFRPVIWGSKSPPVTNQPCQFTASLFECVFYCHGWIRSSSYIMHRILPIIAAPAVDRSSGSTSAVCIVACVVAPVASFPGIECSVHGNAVVSAYDRHSTIFFWFLFWLFLFRKWPFSSHHLNAQARVYVIVSSHLPLVVDGMSCRAEVANVPYQCGEFSILGGGVHQHHTVRSSTSAVA